MLKRILSTISVLALPLAASATDYQTMDHPRQECWNEQVAGQSAGSGIGGAIIGGIAGGILGNQVGGGNGKTVATAVGAMTGAVVGDRMSTGGQSYQTVRRCRTVVDQERVPVYYEPAPVVQQRSYYIERQEPSHREHRRHEHEDQEDQDEHGHDRSEHGDHNHGHHDD